MALPAAMALSGLKADYFSDGLDDVFNRGALLLKSPSLSSVASSEDTYSQESGISSMSSETCPVKNLGPFFDLIISSPQIELKAVPTESMPASPTSPTFPPVSEIFYENRNILDLATNIEWTWNLKVPQIQKDPSYFFENRSQYSRVLGAHLPDHVIFTCRFEECCFEEPRYE